MMTKISIAEDADAWCRRLGNFAPVVYPSMPTAAHSALGARRVFELTGSVSRPMSRATRGAATPFLIAALFVAALGWPLSGVAQMGSGMGGHGGHGGHGDRSPGPAAKNPDATPARAPGPLRAMLGEMRRLRAELLLTSAQIETWSKMEDALRECVELERSRMPILPPGAPIDSPRYIQDLADNERALADAEGRFAAATKTAFAALGPRQSQAARDRLAGAIADAQTTPAAP